MEGWSSLKNAIPPLNLRTRLAIRSPSRRSNASALRKRGSVCDLDEPVLDDRRAVGVVGLEAVDRCPIFLAVLPEPRREFLTREHGFGETDGDTLHARGISP